MSTRDPPRAPGPRSRPRSRPQSSRLVGCAIARFRVTFRFRWTVNVGGGDLQPNLNLEPQVAPFELSMNTMHSCCLMAGGVGARCMRHLAGHSIGFPDSSLAHQTHSYILSSLHQSHSLLSPSLKTSAWLWVLCGDGFPPLPRVGNGTRRVRARRAIW
jgi:hypothetical protein